MMHFGPPREPEGEKDQWGPPDPVGDPTGLKVSGFAFRELPKEHMVEIGQEYAVARPALKKACQEALLLIRDVMIAAYKELLVGKQDKRIKQGDLFNKVKGDIRQIWEGNYPGQIKGMPQPVSNMWFESAGGADRFFDSDLFKAFVIAAQAPLVKGQDESVDYLMREGMPYIWHTHIDILLACKTIAVEIDSLTLMEVVLHDSYEHGRRLKGTSLGLKDGGQRTEYQFGRVVNRGQGAASDQVAVIGTLAMTEPPIKDLKKFMNSRSGREVSRLEEFQNVVRKNFSDEDITERFGTIDRLVWPIMMYVAIPLQVEKTAQHLMSEFYFNIAPVEAKLSIFECSERLPFWELGDRLCDAATFRRYSDSIFFNGPPDQVREKALLYLARFRYTNEKMCRLVESRGDQSFYARNAAGIIWHLALKELETINHYLVANKLEPIKEDEIEDSWEHLYKELFETAERLLKPLVEERVVKKIASPQNSPFHKGRDGKRIPWDLAFLRLATKKINKPPGQQQQ